MPRESEIIQRVEEIKIQKKGPSVEGPFYWYQLELIFKPCGRNST